MSQVYGGGTTGVMGALARTLVSLSGSDSVHGIIPRALEKKERRDGGEYGRVTVVGDLHVRIAMMMQEVENGGPGSGFIALSGGLGTFYELLEVTTKNQLGVHDKPVVIYNVGGLLDKFRSLIKDLIQGGFVNVKDEDIMVWVDNAEDAVRALKEHKISESRLDLNWAKS